MIGVIIALVVVGSAIWVYLDATNHKIGGDFPAGAWAAFVLLLWIIGFPAYLIKRGALLEQAKEHPAEVKNRAPVLVVLGALGAVVIGINLVSYSTGSLPACDAPQVVELAKAGAKQSAVFKVSGIQVISVVHAREMVYNPDTEKRTCQAQMETNVGEQPLVYSIEWQDKDKGEFWVRVAQ
jgi:hypothetical protein